LLNSPTEVDNSATQTRRSRSQRAWRIFRRWGQVSAFLGIVPAHDVKAAGGDAKFLLLPEAGHKGNTHMLMMDKNNLAIADLIIGWLGEAAKK
jgi:hypothetical protein